MKNPLFRLTLAATVVAAAFPAGAFAQQSESCVQLLAMVDDAGDRLAEEFGDARTVAEADESTRCDLYVARVTTAGGLMRAGDADAATAQSEGTTTETVQIEREVTIEGEVQVTLPDPDVRVEQDPAEISVRSSAPEVSISQGQPVIEVRQAQPIITVRMMQPTITVEQPAPEIIVTMPEPGVDVATAQPVVEVNIPEPRVTVTQGQPRLAVDLDTDVGATANADNNTMLDRSDDDGGNMVVTANGVSGSASEPIIDYVEAEEQATVEVQGTEPQVNYIAAEADVRIESEGEPTIEMIDSGEPKIMIRRSGDEEAVDEGAALDAEQPAAVAALASDADVDADADAGTPVAEEQRDPSVAFAQGGDPMLDGGRDSVLTVGDLDGMSVRNARDEELGEVERVVRNGNDTYVIVAHGGWFFGLDEKEVALPIADVTVRGDEVVLRGLTEQQIESMPDYDYANDVELDTSDEITLRRLD